MFNSTKKLLLLFILAVTSAIYLTANGHTSILLWIITIITFIELNEEL